MIKNQCFQTFSLKKNEKGLIHKAEVAVGLKEEEKSAVDEACDMFGCAKMPWKYRIAGYAACAGVGFVMSMGATGRIGDLIAGNPDPFVLLFTFGALITLVGSMFLSTPKAFCKKSVR